MELVHTEADMLLEILDETADYLLISHSQP